MHCHIQLTGSGEQKRSQGREGYEALAAALGVLAEAMAHHTLREDNGGANLPLLKQTHTGVLCKAWLVQATDQTPGIQGSYTK